MKKLRFAIRVLVLSLPLCAATCGSENEQSYKAKVEDPEFIHRSVKQITDRIVHDIFSPPVASRIYTYASVAGYEAIRHLDPSFESVSGQLNGLDSIPQPDPALEYCFPLASVEAYMKIGKTLVFSEPEIEAFHQKMLKEFRDAGVPTEVYDRSIEYGIKVADRVIKWSGKDNYKQTRSFPKYTILSDPATWKPTPPAYMDAVEPHWNKIRPFVLDSAAQFRPEPAVKFAIDKKSQFFKEAQEVYDLGKGLTQEQKEIASFWDCNPFVMNVRGHVMFATKKISPGGHWMNITAVACRKSNATIVQSAEVYARVALSLVDGFISCWDEKYRSKVIRPETYINQYIDENWVPMLQTPPFPEYTSGHSVISASAAVALTGIFGDNFAFTDSTEVEYGMTARSFKSFEHAAQEAAESRMYGGIHYRAACDNGKLQGKMVGEFILNNVKTRKAVSAMK
ncbi:MAG TPA: vanadium-dependent haloperoxidase [Cyclobacteriaceae bacterium]|nr:vanadium-dependent haloperoxidase [Cyclobacteriaceae bacterium]